MPVGGSAPVGGSSAGLMLPPGQQGAAGAYGDLLSPMFNQSINALNIAGQAPPASYAWPYVQQSFQDIYNNLWANQAIAGSQAAGDFFQGAYLPYAQSVAGALGNLGGFASGLAPDIAAAMNNPLFAQAEAAAPGISSNLQSVAGIPLGAAEGQYPVLTGMAGNIWNQAADPQGALFARLQQQLSDQMNAQNSAYGLGSSSYGASVAANALGNLDVNWQNQLLNRMISGGQAAQGLYGQGLTGLMGGANQYSAMNQAALQALLQPAQARSAAALQGSSALGNLMGAAQNAYGGGLNALSGVTSGLASTGALPYQMANTIAGNQMTGAQNLINLGNAQYLLPQQVLSNLMQYMGLGQSASQIAAGINQNAFQNQMMAAQGMGSLAGLGGNMLFGGGGGMFGAPMVGAGAGNLVGADALAGGAGMGAMGADFGGGGSLLGGMAAPLAFS